MCTSSHHGNPADLEAYIERLESPERVQWQKPDDVIATLALRPGSVVCDIGAGPGFFSLRLAQAVGAQGTIYAVDIEPRILAVLVERIETADVSNIVPVLGLAQDPLLPQNTCDVTLLVNTLHHVADPVAYLKALRRSLKQGGRIVNIDFRKRETPMGPPVSERIAQADCIALAEQAGLAVARQHDLLEHQYFIELVVR